MKAFWSSTRTWRFVRLTFALLIGLVFIVGMILQHLVPTFAPHPVRAAWEQARAAGAYDFTATIVHTTNYAASPIKMGQPPTQRSFYLDGEVDQADERMVFALWTHGTSPARDDQALEVEQIGSQVRSRQGNGPWQEQDNFTDSFAPGGDMLGFLAGVESVEETGTETRAGLTFTRYTFTLNGLKLAESLREQMREQMQNVGPLPPGADPDFADYYQEMSGVGELWVTNTGLPLRQILTVRFPEQDGRIVTSNITSDFTNFAPIGMLHTATNWFDSPTAGQTLLYWVLPLLLMGCMSGLLIAFNGRTTRIGIAITMIAVLITGPFLQQVQAAEYGDAQREQAAAQAAEQEQMDAQNAVQARQVVTGSDVDPHTSPLNTLEEPGLQATATAHSAPQAQTSANDAYTCYRTTFSQLTESDSSTLPTGTYWFHADGTKLLRADGITPGSGLTFLNHTTTANTDVCYTDDYIAAYGTILDVVMRYNATTGAGVANLNDDDTFFYGTARLMLSDVVTTTATIGATDVATATLTSIDEAPPFDEVTLDYSVTLIEFDNVQPVPAQFDEDDGTDSDEDGLTDWQEVRIGTVYQDDVLVDANAGLFIAGHDSDTDGIDDLTEITGFSYAGKQWYTDPLDGDSNGDGRDDAEEWGYDDNGALLAVAVDTDGDLTPDLFDEDDDNDQVPDDSDDDPLHALGLTTPFSDTNPLSLTIKNLTVGEPTTIDFQLRPEDEEHIGYALSVLDWPCEDERGQIQDHDCQTYADLGSNDDTATHGDMSMIPLLQITINSSPTHLPLKDIVSDTLTLAPIGDGDVEGDVILSDPTTDDNTFTATIDSVTGTYSALEIQTGDSCTAAELGDSVLNTLGTTSGTFTGLNLTDLTQATDTDYFLVALDSDDTPVGCAELGWLIFDGDKQVDTEKLADYGVTVTDVDENSNSKYAYVPLIVEETQTKARPIAFSGQMFYEPSGTDYADITAHEVRLIWMVEVLNDNCITAEDGYCIEYSDDTDNEQQYVLTYDDTWYLTGMSVREDLGTNAAIFYEDPTQEVDDNGSSTLRNLEYYNALFILLQGLGTNFINSDIAVSDLPGRFDYTQNQTADPETTWGFNENAEANILRVETASYESQLEMIYDMATRWNAEVLDENYTPYLDEWETFNEGRTDKDPLSTLGVVLGYAREETYRNRMLTELATGKVAFDADTSGLTFTIQDDAATDNDAASTDADGDDAYYHIKQVSAAPYEYDNTEQSWQSLERADYWDYLAELYPLESFAIDDGNPLTDTLTDTEEQEGELLLIQHIYLGYLDGYESFLTYEGVDVGTVDQIGIQAFDEFSYAEAASYLQDTTDFIRLYGDDFVGAAGLIIGATELRNQQIVADSIDLGQAASAAQKIKVKINYGKLFRTTFTPMNKSLTLAQDFRSLRPFERTAWSERLYNLDQSFARVTSAKQGALLKGLVRGFTALHIAVIIFSLLVLSIPQLREALQLEGRIVSATVIALLEIYTGFWKPIALRSAALKGTATSTKWTIIKGQIKTLAKATAVITLIIVLILVVMWMIVLLSNDYTPVQRRQITAGFVANIIYVVLISILAVIALIAWPLLLLFILFTIVDIVGTLVFDFSLSDIIIEWITKAIFGVDMIVEIPDDDDALVFTNTDLALTDPEQGYREFAEFSYTTTISAELQHNKPDVWQARAYAYSFLGKSNLQNNTGLGFTITAEAEDPKVGKGDVSWNRDTFEKIGRFGDSVTGGNRWRGVAVYDPVIGEGLTFGAAGINQPTDLYLNTGYYLEFVECFTLVFIPICYWGDEETGGAEDRVIKGNNSVYLGNDLPFDLFPETLDGFRVAQAAAANQYVLPWDERFPIIYDNDGDGLITSYYGGSDPNDNAWDSDGDTLSDEYELTLRTYGADFSLLDDDTDEDGLRDDAEVSAGTNPAKPDTDGDGLTDLEEVNGWTITVTGTSTLTIYVTSDPLSADIDADGISDLAEKELAEVYGLTYNPNVYNTSPLAVYPEIDDEDGIVGPGQTFTYTTTVVSTEDGITYETVNLQVDVPALLGGSIDTDSLNATTLSTNGTVDSIGFTYTVTDTVISSTETLTSTVRARLPSSGSTDAFEWSTNQRIPAAIDGNVFALDSTSIGLVRGDEYRVSVAQNNTANGDEDLLLADLLGTFSATPDSLYDTLGSQLYDYDSNTYSAGYGHFDMGARQRTACTDDGACLTVWDGEDRCRLLQLTRQQVNDGASTLPVGDSSIPPGEFMVALSQNTGGNGGWVSIAGQLQFYDAASGTLARSARPVCADMSDIVTLGFMQARSASSGVYDETNPDDDNSGERVNFNLSVFAPNQNNWTWQVDNSWRYDFTIPDQQTDQLWSALTDSSGTLVLADPDGDGTTGPNLFADTGFSSDTDENPVVASNGADFVVVWVRNNTLNSVQIDGATGAQGTIRSAVSADAADDLDLVATASGRYLLAYASGDTLGVRVLGDTGVFFGSDNYRDSSTDNTATPTLPRLAYNPIDDTALVAYQRSGSDTVVLRGITDATGGNAGLTIEGSAVTLSGASAPRVAYDPVSAAFVVSYENNGNLVARRYSVDLDNADDDGTAEGSVLYDTTAGAATLVSSIDSGAYAHTLSCPALESVAVADWRFEEAAGSTTFVGDSLYALELACSTDEIAAGTCPTAGALARAEGQTNADSDLALYFDGDDEIEGSLNSSFSDDSVSVSVWARRTRTGVAETLFDLNSGDLRLGFTANDEVTCTIESTVLTATPDAVTDSDWHQWTCVYDFTTNEAFLYVDGGGDGSNDYLATATTNNNDAPSGRGINLGVDSSGASYFRGYLDDVTIFATALDADTVADYYQEQTSAACFAAGANSNNDAYSPVTFTLDDTFAQGGFIESSGTLPVLIDTEAPNVDKITAPANGTYYSANTSSITAGGDASDSPGNVALVEVRVNGGDWQAATGTNSWAFNLDLSGLAPGAHVMEARTTDAADLQSNIVTTTFSIDGEAPNTTLDTTSSSFFNLGNGIFVVQATSETVDGQASYIVALNGTMSDPALPDTTPGSGVASVQVLLEGSDRIAGNGWQAATINTNTGTWELDYVLATVDDDGSAVADPSGIYTITVCATDTAGNTSCPESGVIDTSTAQASGAVTDATTPTQITLEVDSTAPVVSLDDILMDTVVFSAPTTLFGTVTEQGDIQAGIASVEVAFVSAGDVYATRPTGNDLLLSFDEPAGRTAFGNTTDSSADGTCEPVERCPTTGAQGRIERAADFDGNDAVVVRDPATPLSYTLALWLNTTSSGSEQVLLTRTTADGSDVVHTLSLNPSGQVVFTAFADDGSSATTTSTTAVTDGAWHQVTGVLEAEGTLRLYIDGYAENTAVLLGSPATTGDRYLIGAAAADGTNGYTGLLDEIQVFHTPLTADEIPSFISLADLVWHQATLNDSGFGVTATTWELALPNDLEDHYQIDARATDVFGNRTATRSDWMLWRGPIDVRAPDLDLDVAYAGSGLILRADYRCTVLDANLDETSVHCPQLSAVSCGIETTMFADSFWWNAVAGDPAYVVGTEQACEAVVTSTAAPQLTACDIYGNCAAVAGAAPPEIGPDLQDVAIVTPGSGVLGITEPMTVAAAAVAPSTNGVAELKIAVRDNQGTQTILDTTTTIAADTTAASASGRWTPTDGTTVELIAIAEFNNGTTLESEPVMVTVDTTLPTLTITSQDSFADADQQSTGFAIGGAYNTPVGGTVSWRIDEGTWQTASTDNTTWAALWSPGNVDGASYTLEARIVDAAEREASAEQIVTVDTVPPEQVTAQLSYITSDGTQVGLVEGQQIGLEAATLQLDWLASSDGSGIAQYQVGWSTGEAIDPDSDTLITVLPNQTLQAQQALPAIDSTEALYVHLFTTDMAGNVREQVFGPIMRTANPAPLLSVTKSGILALDADGDGQLTPGDTVAWTITLRNPGTDTLIDWSVTDDFAAELILDPAGVTSSTGTPTVAGQTLTVSGERLDAGGQVDITVQTVVDLAAVAPGTLSNQARVTATDYNLTGSDDPTTTLFGDATQLTLNAAVVGPEVTPTPTTEPTATPTATPEGGDPSTGPFQIYLPLVHNTPAVITEEPAIEIELTPDQSSYTTAEGVVLRATLTNTGSVETSRAFWVDLFINPAEPLTASTRWDQKCTLEPCYGLAWKVPALAPGAAITLVSLPAGDARLREGELGYTVDQSRWTGQFAAGTTDLIILVDAWNPEAAPAITTVVGPAGDARLERSGLTVTGDTPVPNNASATPLVERPAP